MMKPFIYLISLCFFSLYLEAKPWIGIQLEKHRDGVLVEKVYRQSPGAIGGLLKNDVIVSINKMIIKTPKDLIGQVSSKKAGDTLNIVALRGAKTINKTIKLEEAPDAKTLMRKLNVGVSLATTQVQQINASKASADIFTKNKCLIAKAWATWCPACRSRIKELNRYLKTHNNSLGVAFMMISDEPIAKISQFFEGEAHLKKFQFSDIKGQWADKIMTPSIPTYFLIKNQKVVEILPSIELKGMISLAQKTCKESK